MFSNIYIPYIFIFYYVKCKYRTVRKICKMVLIETIYLSICISIMIHCDNRYEIV